MKFDFTLIIFSIKILIVALPIFLLTVNQLDDLSMNESVRMNEKAIIEYQLHNSLLYVICAFIIFFYFQFTNLPNEIHRYNARHKNWKRPLLIMGSIFLVFIVVNFILYMNHQPVWMRSTMGILLFTPFIWIRNNQILEGEKA